MINVVIESKQIEAIQADVEIVFVFNKNLDQENIGEKSLLTKMKFKGEDEQCVYSPVSEKIYVGVEKTEGDNIRIASSVAIKKIKSLSGVKSAKISLLGFASGEDLGAIVEGTILGFYEFSKYKSKKDEDKLESMTVFVASGGYEVSVLEAVSQKAIVVANAVNFTRDIVNTPPNDIYPQTMADIASTLANENKIECKVYDESYLEANGMGAMLAVSLASVHRPRLVHMSYKPQNPKAKVILVGKGLTYDSGGLSLKPSDFMVTMKADKSGASAVIGIMKAVSELGLDVEVHGICGIVENMIGGNAYKPDDVLKAKNGTTIEVRNTDAEGRLVLADCLSYAQDEIKEFDYIFDFATLTGACVVGVGEYTTGIMGHSNKLKHMLFDAANKSGELVAALPFNRHLKKHLKSEIADICNISNTRYGGAITAALFLDKFINEENKDKWAHLDIAGPAFVERTWGYNPHGASGAGVRLAISFLEKL